MTTATRGNASLVLTRRAGGWRDRARSYILVIDDAEIAKLRHGGRFETSLDPGRHEIFLRISWCRSQVIKVDARPGEVIRLHCAPGNAPPLASATIGQDSYIQLARI